METIKELGERLHGNKRERMKHMWGHREFNQNPALYLSYFILKKNIKVTPNQVTYFFVILSFIASILLFFSGFWIKIIALLLLWLCLILDGVDGDIARYKNIFSLKGLYVDSIYHLVGPSLFLFGLAYSISKTTSLNSELILLAGIFGGLSWSVLKANGQLPFHLCCKYYLKNPDMWGIKKDESSQSIVNDKILTQSFIRKILAIRFQFRQFFMAMWITFFSLIIEKLFLNNPESYPLTSWVVLIYGVFLTLHLIEEILKSSSYIEKLISKVGKNYINN